MSLTQRVTTRRVDGPSTSNGSRNMLEGTGMWIAPRLLLARDADDAYLGSNTVLLMYGAREVKTYV